MATTAAAAVTLELTDPLFESEPLQFRRTTMAVVVLAGLITAVGVGGWLHEMWRKQSHRWRTLKATQTVLLGSAALVALDIWYDVAILSRFFANGWAVPFVAQLGVIVGSGAVEAFQFETEAKQNGDNNRLLRGMVRAHPI
jgi:hypothetical protein